MKATGAEVLAFGKHRDKDCDVVPDRVIGEGDTIEGTEFGLEVLHTPGHAPNHLCFLLDEERLLFTGDTVLDGTWSVRESQARGGDMTAYLRRSNGSASSARRRIAPGHGDVIEEPRARIDEYLAHRRQREQQILRFVKKQGDTKVAEIVAAALRQPGSATRARRGGRLAGPRTPAAPQVRRKGRRQLRGGLDVRLIARPSVER